jgi:hypothetical protein
VKRVTAVLFGLVITFGAACGAGGGPTSPSVTATKIALQDQDLPGFTRCPQSGPIDVVVETLRAGGDTHDTENLTTGLAAAKELGVADGVYVGYASDPASCSSTLFGSGDTFSLHEKWWLCMVIKFKDSDAAKTAYTNGLFLFGFTPDSYSKLGGGNQGVQTGFGTTSYTTEVFSEYFAYVAKDNVLIEMGGGNQFEFQAAAVAKKVYQRA